jgi:hypothetical protein
MSKYNRYEDNQIKLVRICDMEIGKLIDRA